MAAPDTAMPERSAIPLNLARDKAVRTTCIREVGMTESQQVVYQPRSSGGFKKCGRICCDCGNRSQDPTPPHDSCRVSVPVQMVSRRLRTKLIRQLNAEWCKEQQVAPRFIRPDRPGQNAYIGRFNRTFARTSSAPICSTGWMRLFNVGDTRPAWHVVSWVTASPEW